MTATIAAAYIKTDMCLIIFMKISNRYSVRKKLAGKSLLIRPPYKWGLSMPLLVRRKAHQAKEKMWLPQ